MMWVKPMANSEENNRAKQEYDNFLFFWKKCEEQTKN